MPDTPAQLTLDGGHVPLDQLPDPDNGCPGCAGRNPFTDPPCPLCGADDDPETRTGIPF